MSTRPSVVVTAILCTLVAVFSRPPAEAGDEVMTGARLDLDLTTGEDWHGEFTVAGESYLEAVVEQRSLDVGVRLLAAGGQEIAAADGPGGVGVDERLASHLEAGRYRLVISPTPGGPPDGRVRLRIESLRPWSAADHERLEWVAVSQRATHLDGSSAQADWDESYDLSLRELEAWRRLGDATATVRTLNRLVSLERALGKTELSIEHGIEAVRISLANGNQRAEAASRYWLGQSLIRQGLVDEAQGEFTLGLEAARSVGDLQLQGRILNWQARLRARRGDNQTARELFEEALGLRTRAHDLRGVSSIMNNLGTIAVDLGEFTRALGYFQEAVASATRQGIAGTARLATANLAGLLIRRGQWQEALDALEATLTNATAAGDHRNESLLGMELAGMLTTLGELDRARELLERALYIERRRRDARLQVRILVSLSQIHSSQERPTEAEAALNEAYGLAATHDLQEQASYILRAQATLHMDQGRPGEAAERLSLAQRTPSFASQPVERAGVLLGLGEVWLAQDDPDQALEHLAQAAEALGPIAAPERRFAIAYQRARAHYALGALPEALDEAERALKIADTLRSAVDDAGLRATYQERVREAYDFCVGLLLELHSAQPDAGFDRRSFLTFERARARSLAELLTTARFGAEQRIDPALLDLERSASAAVAQARERLAAAGGGSTETLDVLTLGLDEALGALSEAEAEIRRSAPRYASLRYGHQHSVEDIQRALGADTALVEYALRPGRSVAWVLTNDRFETLALASEGELEELSTQLRGMLTQPARRSFGQLQQRSRALGALLLDGVLEAADGRRRLTVVPDGPLAYLPFEALRVADPDQGEDRYLAEDFVVSYTPSAGVLLALTADGSRRDHEATLVAFADPDPPPPHTGQPSAWQRLPGSRREVSALASTFADASVVTFVDTGASEGRFKNEPSVHHARWIHLASHALVNEAIPGKSAVVLAAGEDRAEDGYLTVQEVFALSLDADLVVLSGCETALGRQIRGEGLVGLTRAFLYAGARGLQVSLWKVADHTTPSLMASLYDALERGLEPAAALREAKLESLSDPSRAHPFHWAAFVHVGGTLMNQEGTP